MTDKPDHLRDDALDALLRAARAAPPPPLPAGLAERLMADALASMPVPSPHASPSPAGWFGGLGRLLDRLSGAMPGAAGLAVAALAGVWIGFAPPTAADGVIDLVWQGAAVLNPDFDLGAGTTPDFLFLPADLAEFAP